MRTLGLGQSLEPIGDFVEAFLACGAGHTRVHVGVFVGFTCDCSLQVVRGRADRQTGRRVSGFFQVLKVAVGMAGFTFGGGAENYGDVVVTLTSARCAKYR